MIRIHFSSFLRPQRVGLALLAPLCATPALAQEVFFGSSNTVIMKGDADAGNFTPVSACGGQVNSMVLSGDTLHVGDVNGNVYVYNDATHSIAYAYTLDTDARAMARNATNVVVGGGNGKIFVVDPATGVPSVVHQLPTTVDALALRGSTLIAGSTSQSVWVGDLVQGNFFNLLACAACGPIQSMATDGDDLFMGDTAGNIYHYNFNVGIVSYSFTVPSDTTALVVDGGDLLIGGSNGIILRVNRNTGQQVSSFDVSFDVQGMAIEPTLHPGTGFCFGLSCPCGNDNLTGGCANSTGHGAVLSGTGSTSVAADDLVLKVTNMPLATLARFYMSSQQTVMPFGDGLLCAGGGGYPSFRFRAASSFPTGTLTQGPGTVAHSAHFFGPSGLITPGTTWNFQVWYRNPHGPCGGLINVSNAYSVSFAP